VRENTEGPYAGEGGILRRGTPHEVATQGSVNTRFGVERCVRYAFERASSLQTPRLTLVHKTNVLTFAGDLWSRVVNEVGAEFPSVAVDYNHVDAACIYLVESPQRYGVIVTDNLFGDILSDLAGAVTGGIGFAASANLNPRAPAPHSSNRSTARRTTSSAPVRLIPWPPCRRPFSCSSTWKKWTPHGVLLKRWQTLMVRSLRSARTASRKI